MTNSKDKSKKSSKKSANKSEPSVKAKRANSNKNAKLMRQEKRKAKKEAKKNRIPIISIWQIYKLTGTEISNFWKPLLGVITVYAVINFIFIASFSLFPSNEALQAEVEGWLGEDASRIAGSITLVGSSLLDYTSPSNTLLQIVLFIIASMAFVWTLRKLRGLKKIDIRQAYYEGPANIVPLIIVATLLLLTLTPAAIASTTLAFGLQNGVFGLEKLILYSFAFIFIFLSYYWLLVWWPSFYIIMLPGTRPITAMRAAAELTKYNRFKLFLRGLGILLTLVVSFLAIAIPVSLIWQRIIPITVYAMVFILFGILHVMLFSMYRSMVDAKQS